MSPQADTIDRPVHDVSQNLSRVVRILLALDGMEIGTLAKRLRMSASNLSNTLAGRRKWSVEDVYRLAEVFDCPVSVFFEPADTLVRNRCFRDCIDEFGRELAGNALAEQLTLDFPPTLELVADTAALPRMTDTREPLRLVS